MVQDIEMTEDIENLFRLSDGAIPMRELNSKLHLLGLSPVLRRRIALAADRNKDGYLSYDEYRRYVDDDRRPSSLRLVLSAAVRSVAPRNHADNYLDHYDCMPPPLFILLITIAQVAVFVYYAFKLKDTTDPVTAYSGLDADSPLIYSPRLRREAWRFVSYMFLHSGYMHLISNMVFQMLIGLPLEMVHKFHRIGFVYTLGVIAGSLGCSVFDRTVYLVGASGGSYALIGAHFSIIIMNWKEMRFTLDNSILQAILSAPVRLFFWCILVGADFGNVIYMRFTHQETSISYIAHLMGFITGILGGTAVLRNLVVERWEKYLLWISAAIYTGFVIFAVLFNIYADPI